MKDKDTKMLVEAYGRVHGLYNRTLVMKVDELKKKLGIPKDEDIEIEPILDGEAVEWDRSGTAEGWERIFKGIRILNLDTDSIQTMSIKELKKILKKKLNIPEGVDVEIEPTIEETPIDWDRAGGATDYAEVLVGIKIVM